MDQERWQRWTEWPLTATALVFVAAYAVEVLFNVPESRAPELDAIIIGTWVVFVLDYLVNLYLAPQRWRWFGRNLHLLLIVALPILRPLRLLRLVTLLALLQRRAGSALRGSVVAYVACSAALLVFVGALAALDAEQNDPAANIRSFGDALWWACVTITTVGYGDHYPVTMIGRMVAVGLMISGITVLGVVTATVATWLVQRVADEAAAAEIPAKIELHHVMAELQALRAEVAAMREADDPPEPRREDDDGGTS
ncbi:MAG: potassium channel family protein [Actinomycetota bacterium]|nr:potassium channel family protein [Actinomycetota bacterium]